MLIILKVVYEEMNNNISVLSLKNVLDLNYLIYYKKNKFLEISIVVLFGILFLLLLVYFFVYVF